MVKRKKRILSLVLTLAMTLECLPTWAGTEPGAISGTLPEQIDSNTVWSYLDDNTDPAGDSTAEGYHRTSWTTADFDDSSWKTAKGSFGAKNDGTSDGAANKLAGIGGADGNGDNYTTYYFRTKVNVPDSSAVTKITGSIKYDDAAILYINGVRAEGFNDAGCDSNSSYCDYKADTTSSFEITDAAVLNGLKNGENVVAVEIHQESRDSSDIWFSMSDLTFSVEPLAVRDTLIDNKTTWSYLDDSTDPAGDSNAEGYDRTSWTTADFDDSAWKTAAASVPISFRAVIRDRSVYRRLVFSL